MIATVLGILLISFYVFLALFPFYFSGKYFAVKRRTILGVAPDSLKAYKNITRGDVLSLLFLVSPWSGLLSVILGCAGQHGSNPKTAYVVAAFILLNILFLVGVAEGSRMTHEKIIEFNGKGHSGDIRGCDM